MSKKAKPKPPKIKWKWRTAQLRFFWYWINERHKIYEARKAGKAFPWTTDKILCEYKFTNPFRQHDRVTQEWTKRYISLLGSQKDLKDEDLLFHVCMFRLFNWPDTYDALHFGMRKWDLKKAIEILHARKKEGKQIFTGAYIIPSAGKPDKAKTIAEALEKIWDGRTEKEIEDKKKPTRVLFARKIKRKQSMKFATQLLQKIPTVGPFIAYEIVCDLRHTRLLADARDKLAWANAGPGAMRGIHRLLWGTYEVPDGKERPDYNRAMRALLKMAPRKLSKAVKTCGTPFEMREIEHSLCEFDKYMRLKRKEGKTRSKFTAPVQEQLPWD
jgi:hypothetical protein